MEIIGSLDAEADLPQLLERVTRGEEFTIVQHGKPIARLIPASTLEPTPDVQQVIEELKAFGQSNTLGGGTTIREMIDEGRRL